MHYIPSFKNLMGGAVTIVTVTPDGVPFNFGSIESIIFQSDADALRSDWMVVGELLQDAVDTEGSLIDEFAEQRQAVLIPDASSI